MQQDQIGAFFRLLFRAVGYIGMGLLGLAVLFYLGALAYLYIEQRKFLYHPTEREVAPAQAGLERFERISLTTEDGERLLAWRLPPAPGSPMLLYLHGNADGLEARARRFAAFAAAGFGVLAVEYRGFAGSTGHPDETGLTLDAEAGYQAALADAPADRIVLMGESLGTGLAVKLAARHAVGAVVLDSPYTSITDVAAAHFWMFPVRLLLHDAFDSAALIGAVKAPMLIVHGVQDNVVPYRFGRRLYDLASSQKAFIAVEGYGHLAMGVRLEETIAWIKDRIR